MIFLLFDRQARGAGADRVPLISTIPSSNATTCTTDGTEWRLLSHGWDGYFWYRARTDDMIVLPATTSPARGRERAARYPQVAECAVVGVPDEDRGQLRRRSSS